jgi:hypothetical protein
MKQSSVPLAVLLIILLLVGFPPVEKVNANPYSHPGTRPQIIIVTPPDPHKRGCALNFNAQKNYGEHDS